MAAVVIQLTSKATTIAMPPIARRAAVEEALMGSESKANRTCESKVFPS